MRILVIEDERKTASFIRKALQSEGFTVETVRDGEEGIVLATTTQFDVILLDIMLPGQDGLSVLRQLRSRRVSTAIMILSAHGAPLERVRGLNAGADDYLAKPFILNELIARVRALMRRAGQPQTTRLQVANLVLDAIAHEVRRGDTLIALAKREYRLLEFLMRSPGRVYGRVAILEHLWDYDFDPGSNIVDVYIKRLRAKVDEDFEPKLLHTVRGFGYVLKEP